MTSAARPAAWLLALGLLALPVDGRVDQTGCNRVNANTHGAQVSGDRQGHPHYATFRGGIGRLADLAVKGGGGGHVYDRPTGPVGIHWLGLCHGRSRTAQHVKCPYKIDLNDKIETLDIHGLIVAVNGAGGQAEAGRIHTNAQWVQRGGGGNNGIDVVSLGDVALDENATDFVGDLLSTLFVKVGHDHFGTGFGQLACGRLTNTGGASRNNG